MLSLVALALLRVRGAHNGMACDGVVPRTAPCLGMSGFHFRGGGVNRAPQNWGGGGRAQLTGTIKQSICSLVPKAPKIFLSTKIGRFFFHQIHGE